jgi:hypothetical protein
MTSEEIKKQVATYVIAPTKTPEMEKFLQAAKEKK